MNKRKHILMAILSAVLTLLVLISTAMPAFAAQSGATLDWSKKGSVMITLKCKGEPVPQAQFTIYKVADAKNVNGSLNFEYTAGFADFPLSIERLTGAQAPKRVLEYINNKGISGSSRQTNQKGIVKFSSLELGIYLVAQTKSVIDYTDCTPFLVFIPYYNDGAWVYSTDATPKINIQKIVDAVTDPEYSFSNSKTNTSKHEQGSDPSTTNSTSNTTKWEYDPNDPTDPNNPNNPSNPNHNPSTTIVHNGTDIYGNPVTSSHGHDTELIKTGQNKTIVPLLAVCGIVIFSLGCIMFNRGRREYCD